MDVLNHSIFRCLLARVTAWALVIAIIFAGIAGHTNAGWSHSAGMQKVEMTSSSVSADCAGHFGNKSAAQDKQVACSPSMGFFIFDSARQEVRSIVFFDANFVLPFASLPDSRNTVPPTPPPNSIMIA
jgi:hypothetical protein